MWNPFKHVILENADVYGDMVEYFDTTKITANTWVGCSGSPYIDPYYYIDVSGTFGHPYALHGDYGLVTCKYCGTRNVTKHMLVWNCGSCGAPL